MKRILAACLCMLLLGCATPEQPQRTAAPAAAETATPASNDAVVLQAHPFVYQSGDTTYLYASGKSVALYKGEIFGGVYNYLTDGSSLCYIDPNGKLYRFDGETTAVILETAPESIGETMECFDDGTFLYLDNSTLSYFDGARFVCLLENVKEFRLATFPKDTLSERIVDQ